MNNNNRRLQPFFADPTPHGVGSYDEDELEESDKSSPEAEEEDEYDVNNDETFGNTEAGATGHAQAEPDLEEFANRTACFLFDDVPAARVGKLPNPDDIPMPVFDRSTPAVDNVRHKVLEQSISAEVMANIWGRQTINGAQPISLIPSESSGGGSALDEIERRLGSLGREISTSQWPPDLKLKSEENYQHLTSPGVARSAFNAAELEQRMLMEAAAAAIRRQQSPLLPLPAGVIRPTPINPTTSLQSPSFNLTQSLSPHAPPPGFPRPILPPHFVASLMSPTSTAHQHPHSIPPPMQFTTPPPPHTALPPPHGMRWVRSPQPMQHPHLQHSHHPPPNRSVNVNMAAHGIFPPPPPQWPGNLIAGRGARGMGVPPPFPPTNMLAYSYNSQFPPLPSQQRTAGAVPEVSLVSIRPLSPAFANMPSCMEQRRAVAPQQRSSDTYVFRRKPNNLPSSRTISDYAFDPYAGFLSKKEREWLIKIHLIQCAGTGDPLEDDFYYTAWKQRNVLKRRSDGTRKEKGRYYSFEDTYPSDRYIPPSFSGSLGRLTHCSATLPRQVIDVASHDDAQEEDDGSGTKSGGTQQKKLKIALVRIENAALVLIECRDALRQLASLSNEGEEEESRAQLIELLQRHSDALFNYASNGHLLPTIMAIQKGRALLFEMMTAGIFHEGQLVRVTSLLYACMPKYAKRIPNESIPTTIRGLSRVLSSISDEKLLIDLANSCAVDEGLLESFKFVQLSLLALLIALANCHCSARQLSDSSPLLQWLKSDASASKFNPNVMKLEDLPFRAEHLLSLLHWLLLATGDGSGGGGTEGMETNAQRLLASLEKVLASGSEL